MKNRILIIEDDDQVRSMLRYQLEEAGFEVYEASDGRKGLDRFHETPSPLVITDLIMPDVEGIETIRELKKNDSEVKIIAISGGGRVNPDNYLKIAKKIGADRVFAKPIDWSELLQAVGDLLH
ncbi:MAG: response regulator [Planctomycetota bacterium]